jgi:hypothetical protein
MHERIVTLVERMHERTKARRLSWDKNPKGNFETSFPNYTVELSEDSDWNIWLYIYNDEGEVIDTVSDEMLRQSTPRGAKLAELYTMARRTALGSDEAIENLISALED